MTHLETLKVMRDFYDGGVLKHPEKVAALEAAIAAMEAVEKTRAILDGYYDNNVPDSGTTIYEIRKAVRADAVGGE